LVPERTCSFTDIPRHIGGKVVLKVILVVLLDAITKTVLKLRLVVPDLRTLVPTRAKIHLRSYSKITTDPDCLSLILK
jgi:hypothetical protein